jgi:hypothetical protein
VAPLAIDDGPSRAGDQDRPILARVAESERNIKSQFLGHDEVKRSLDQS